MKRVKNYLRQLKRLLLISFYTYFYNNPKLESKWILVSSNQGKEIRSNMLRIVEQLAHNKDYEKYNIFLSCNKASKNQLISLLKRYNIKNVKLVKQNGFKFAKIMAKTTYLFTDSTFPTWYTKKTGQIITNMRSGEPFKKMGRDVISNAYNMGNIQRNYVMADYLVFPNEYMEKRVVTSYCIENLFKGKVIHAGSPKNTVFFNDERQGVIKKNLGYDGKKVYAYMPVSKTSPKASDFTKSVLKFEYYLTQIDNKLKNNEILLVKLDTKISNKIDYSKFRKVRAFPKKYEQQEVLSICDCLISDYSNAIFDYANTGKKIVLFVYDKDLVNHKWSNFISIDEFPFPQVRTVDSLIMEARSKKTYDDSEFIRKYGELEGKDTTEKLCSQIIKGKNIFSTKKLGNGKENIVIFVGGLARNGITTAITSVLQSIDLEKRNYFATFVPEHLKKTPSRVSIIPDNVGLAPVTSLGCKSLGERLFLMIYYRQKKISPFIKKKVERYYNRVYKLNFGQCEFDWVVQYSGYQNDMIGMFAQASAKKVIYVHNDMVAEIKTRGIQHKQTLEMAYRTYDVVVPVTVDICPPTRELGGENAVLKVVNNCHDYKEVRNRAEKEIAFDIGTTANISVADIKEVLDSKAFKIITIGRYSPEKAHKRLLSAFEKYYKQDKDSYLIIIGGHGKLYKETVDYANSLSSKDNIIIIKSLSNPMPILGKCDLFILPSLYEGLGLVMLEADTLGVPVIATDIPGPRGFLKKYGGHLVPSSTEGIYKGILDYKAGKVKPMNVDYEEYNREAVNQFEQLFEGETSK